MTTTTIATNTIAPGKLRWVGTNLGFATPIVTDVIDDSGNWHSFDLSRLLARLDDFEGRRGNQTVKENVIECAFIAYTNGAMGDDERLAFEGFVREQLHRTARIDAAKAVLLRQ